MRPTYRMYPEKVDWRSVVRAVPSKRVKFSQFTRRLDNLITATFLKQLCGQSTQKLSFSAHEKHLGRLSFVMVRLLLMCRTLRMTSCCHPTIWNTLRIQSKH